MNRRICNGPECIRVAQRDGLCHTHLAQRARGEQLTPVRRRRHRGYDHDLTAP